MTSDRSRVEDKARGVTLYGAGAARRLRALLSRALNDRERNRRWFLVYCMGIIVTFAMTFPTRTAPGFPLGGPGDFTSFYTAAHIIRGGNAHRLYDLSLQAQVQQAFLLPHGWVFADGVLPYAYPPFFAIIFIPLSFLPLGWAFHVWNVVNVTLILASVKLLLRHQQRHSTRDFVVACLIVFAFFPVLTGLHNGQSSFLVLFTLTLTYLALKSRRDTVGGIALALGLFKPQLVLVIAAVLLYRRRWRTVLAFSATAVLLLLVSYILVGIDGMASYLDLVRQMSSWKGDYSINPTNMPNLRGTVYRLGYLYHAWFDTELSPATLGAITFLLSLPVFVWVLRIWKGQWNPTLPEFDLRFGLTVIAALLLSPHLNDHDLTLLVLVGFLLLNFFAHYSRSIQAHRMIAAVHVALLLLFLLLQYAMRGAGQFLAIALLLVSFMVVLRKEVAPRCMGAKNWEKK